LSWRRSRQKPRFLPAETQAMSEKLPQSYMLTQPAKTTLFAGGTQAMSEKLPQAIFLINKRTGACRMPSFGW
jgi:hypothetical protein